MSVQNLLNLLVAMEDLPVLALIMGNELWYSPHGELLTHHKIKDMLSSNHSNPFGIDIVEKRIKDIVVSPN